MAGKVEITMLSGMADRDIIRAMDWHLAWGLRVLDLKDGLFGKSVECLSGSEASLIRKEADARKLSVHTLSTVLFSDEIEKGEEYFRERHLGQLARAIENARILGPHQIRLLAASTSRRAELLDSMEYARKQHPWIFDLYREAVDRIAEAGFLAVIESEIGNCMFSRPSEIHAFFDLVGRSAQLRLVWDIQNLWQMGTFPTVEVYRQLRPLIGMIHLKGGMAEIDGGPLVYRSNLERASWPVEEIISAALRDGVSPVICLNPSHGREHPDYNDDPSVDLEFVRKIIGRSGI